MGSPPSTVPIPAGNRFLDALSPEIRESLATTFSTIELKEGQVLWEAGTAVPGLYFPIDAVAMVTAPAENGSMIELYTIGHESAVGMWSVNAGGAIPIGAVCVIPGSVAFVEREAFAGIAEAEPVLWNLLQAVTRRVLFSLAKSVVCNRFHSLQQRAAKLLLSLHDRSGGRSFHMTQETLAGYLGGDRASVALRQEHLRAHDCITYRRGTIQVVDPARLERFVCACYGEVKAVLAEPLAF